MRIWVQIPCTLVESQAYPCMPLTSASDPGSSVATQTTEMVSFRFNEKNSVLDKTEISRGRRTTSYPPHPPPPHAHTPTCQQKKNVRANKMAQWIKILARQAWSLESNLWNPGQKENQFLKLSSVSPMCYDMHTLVLTHTHHPPLRNFSVAVVTLRLPRLSHGEPCGW